MKFSFGLFKVNLKDYLDNLFQSQDDRSYPRYIKDESYILPDHESDLEPLVLFIKNNPGIYLELQLFSDYRGSENDPFRILNERASKTIEYLKSEIGTSKIVRTISINSVLPCFRLRSA